MFTSLLARNRPFPSSLLPQFQSESKCETFLMKMTLICMKMKLHAELIFIWKVSPLDSLWNRGTRELGNGLFKSRDDSNGRISLFCFYTHSCDQLRVTNCTTATSQVNQHVLWIGWQQRYKHFSRICLWTLGLSVILNFGNLQVSGQVY